MSAWGSARAGRRAAQAMATTARPAEPRRGRSVLVMRDPASRQRPPSHRKILHRARSICISRDMARAARRRAGPMRLTSTPARGHSAADTRRQRLFAARAAVARRCSRSSARGCSGRCVTPVAPLGDWRRRSRPSRGSPADVLRGFDPFFRISGAQTGPAAVTRCNSSCSARGSTRRRGAARRSSPGRTGCRTASRWAKRSRPASG